MCESSVYLIKGSKRELVLEDVVRVLVEGDSITCTNTLGETRTLPGTKIAEANLIKHEIILRNIES